MSKILITGGAGYIGSELTEHLLRDGHEVTVYDSLMYDPTSLLRYAINPNFNFVKADVRNLDNKISTWCSKTTHKVLSSPSILMP